MRINRYLAECGLGSRRKCEQIVLDGRVKKNGRPIRELATEIDPERDVVAVDGQTVSTAARRVYLMLNKTVLELLRGKYDRYRLFPVGRLDYDTEGLLLITNDGETANRITHPRNEVPKTYIAKIEGAVEESDLDKIRRGVILDGVKTKHCRVKLLEFSDNISRLEVVITEGRNRQVRRMFESINREVIFLKRTAVGDLKLGGLYRGEYRELSEKEIQYITQV